MFLIFNIIDSSAFFFKPITILWSGGSCWLNDFLLECKCCDDNLFSRLRLACFDFISSRPNLLNQENIVDLPVHLYTEIQDLIRWFRYVKPFLFIYTLRYRTLLVGSELQVYKTLYVHLYTEIQDLISWFRYVNIFLFIYTRRYRT